ncbi:hypothetical protein MXB_2673, partial [Myxobolus squamalis]
MLIAKKLEILKKMKTKKIIFKLTMELLRYSNISHAFCEEFKETSSPYISFLIRISEEKSCIHKNTVDILDFKRKWNQCVYELYQLKLIGNDDKCDQIKMKKLSEMSSSDQINSILVSIPRQVKVEEILFENNRMNLYHLFVILCKALKYKEFTDIWNSRLIKENVEFQN